MRQASQRAYGLVPGGMCACCACTQVGIDVGLVRSEVSEVTGRLQYRGRVMNRAARVAGKVRQGSPRFL